MPAFLELIVANFSINTCIFCPFCLTQQRYVSFLTVYEFFGNIFQKPPPSSLGSQDSH